MDPTGTALGPVEPWVGHDIAALNAAQQGAGYVSPMPGQVPMLNHAEDSTGAHRVLANRTAQDPMAHAQTTQATAYYGSM